MSKITDEKLTANISQQPVTEYVTFWGKIKGDLEKQEDLSKALANLKSLSVSLVDNLKIKVADIAYKLDNLKTSDLVNDGNGGSELDPFITETDLQNVYNELSDHSTPAGGQTGQVLTKKSDSNYDFEWKTPRGGSSGDCEFTEAVKQAILNCFEHVAWTDDHGQEYYDDLYEAIYGTKELTSISAVFTQGQTVIYPNTPLNDLKSMLVVAAYYSDNTSEVVSDYTLSGLLTEGTSTITVTYESLTTTFTCTVSHESRWS